MRKVVIAGGSGFLGSLLAKYLAPSCEVVILSRDAPLSRTPSGIRYCRWEGTTLGPWTAELENAHALINLAGRSVNCRYTRENRRNIMDSRIIPTRLLGAAVETCHRPPAVWLNASTATIYRHTHGSAWDETGDIGPTAEAHDAFSLDVARAWESAFFSHGKDGQPVTPAGTRLAAMRIAIVLSPRANTMLGILRLLARLHLAGTMGPGTQWVSWIHALDFCRAVEFIIDRDLSGIVNIAAPEPQTNAAFLKIMRDHLGHPFALPNPKWLLELGAFFHRTETELLLKSRRVISTRLPEAGFTFRFPTLPEAIVDLLPRAELHPQATAA